VFKQLGNNKPVKQTFDLHPAVAEKSVCETADIVQNLKNMYR